MTTEADRARDDLVVVHRASEVPAPGGIDADAINAIRFLTIDAVERAKSGHPGTPMGLAPLAYRLFTRHLRHDPAHPDWPDRDRFVLSGGHASMLLYASLAPERLRPLDRRHQAVPPVGLTHAGASRARRDAGGRGDHRPARPGLRQRGRDGARRAHAGRPLQPARPRYRRPPHLRVLRRGRHDGGHLQRGGLARRPPASRPRQAHRLLRQQSRDARRRRRRRVRRERRRALRRLRLARRRGEQRQCAFGDRPGDRGRRGGDEPAQPGPRAQPYRLWLAGPGHRESPRRAARRGRTSPGPARPWAGRTRRSRFRERCTTTGAARSPSRRRHGPPGSSASSATGPSIRSRRPSSSA